MVLQSFKIFKPIHSTISTTVGSFLLLLDYNYSEDSVLWTGVEGSGCIWESDSSIDQGASQFSVSTWGFPPVVDTSNRFSSLDDGVCRIQFLHRATGRWEFEGLSSDVHILSVEFL